MKILNSILASIAYGLLTNFANAHPSPQELGKILGYPSSEILITEATDEERLVIGTPSAKERRSSGRFVSSGDQLLAAYKIRAKVPGTFYPIIVYIAKEGAFLTADLQNTLAGLSSLPDQPITQGGKGVLGYLKVEGASEAGVYIGKLKRPSRDAAISEPLERMAMIAVARLASKPVEVKVAIMAALEGGVDLKPIKGGDLYFQKFGPLAGEGADHPIILHSILDEFNKLALSNSDFSSAQNLDRAPQVGGAEPSENASKSARRGEVSSEKDKNRSLILVIFGVVVLLLAILLFCRKKRS